MTSKKDDMHEALFDKRVVEQNIEKGLITRKEYNSYLKSLKDEGSECAPVEVSKETASTS